MKDKIVNLSVIHADIERLFSMLNIDFFNGRLPAPTISIVPTARNGYIGFNPDTEWVVQNKAVRKSELNISSDILSQPIETICAKLLHVMCHIDNHLLGVKDTSNKMVYHNKYFKKSAESHGLMVTRSKKYGYDTTHPAPSLIEWITENGLTSFRVQRNSIIAENKTSVIKTNSPLIATSMNIVNDYSHHRKYQFPKCGWSCRATSAGNLLCCGRNESPHNPIAMVISYSKYSKQIV